MTSTSRKALDFQEKFEFYFVSLTFTLLALAIQSVDGSQNKLLAIIEVCGWVVLLASGLVQLYRLQMVATALRYEAAEKQNFQIDTGHRDYVHSMIAVTYSASKWLFALGVIGIVCSRAAGHIQNVFL